MIAGLVLFEVDTGLGLVALRTRELIPLIRVIHIESILSRVTGCIVL